MIRMSIRHMLAQRRQLLGVAIALVLSIAFLTITQLLGATLESGLRDSVGRAYQHTDLAIGQNDASFTPGQIAEITQLSAVTAVQPSAPFWTSYTRQGTITPLALAKTPQPGSLFDNLDLVEGAWPTSPGQIVLHKDSARAARIEPGDTIALALPGTDATSTLTVTGIWGGGGHFGADPVDGFISGNDWDAMAPQLWISGLYMTLAEGTSPETVIPAIAEVTGPSLTFETRADLIEREMNDAELERRLLGIGITTFALLTLVVAALVISNTFAILLAQRSRDIALLRCAGATSSQVRRLVLAEAIGIGIVSAVAGIALAWLGGEVLLRFIAWRWDTAIFPDHVVLTAPAIAIALVAGVVLATGAAWLPARTAMAVDPLVALRSAQAPVASNQPTAPVRTGIAIVLVLAGAAVLLGGVVLSQGGSQQYGTLIGMFGGMLSFGGIVFGAGLIVPAIARLLARAGGRTGGVPARVATINGIRNPRRTTSTAIALVIGVTLVTMMAVGAESLRETLLGEVDGRVPVDYVVAFSDGDVAANRQAFISDLAGLPGIDHLATFSTTEATIASPSLTSDSVTFDLQLANPAALNDVWRDRNTPLALETGTILAPAWVFEISGATPGDTTSVQVGNLRQPVLLVEDDRLDTPLMALATLPEMSATTPDRIWLRLNDYADHDTTIDEIYTLADQHGVVLQNLNASDYRETLESALDTMLLIVVGLLAVAVIIALIGVSNTLSLSVLERTRESALLRALGFTRNQLRQSLAFEGLFLAAIGSGIGIVLGVAYGWLGTFTLVGNALTPVIAVPWISLGVITLIALGCGVLASVLPARRAARVEPVVALADR